MIVLFVFCFFDPILVNVEREAPLILRIKQEVDTEEGEEEVEQEEEAEEVDPQEGSEGCSRTLPRLPEGWLRKLESRNRSHPANGIPVGIAVARQRTDSASKSGRVGSVQLDTHPVPCAPRPVDLSHPELYINAASSGLGHLNYSASGGSSIYSVHSSNWSWSSNPASAENHLSASAPAGVWPPPADVGPVLGYSYPAPAPSSVLSAPHPVAGLTTSPYLLIPAACLGQFPSVSPLHFVSIDFFSQFVNTVHPFDIGSTMGQRIRTGACGTIVSLTLESPAFPHAIYFLKQDETKGKKNNQTKQQQQQQKKNNSSSNNKNNFIRVYESIIFNTGSSY